ncbi:hypothetical protein Ataiwa_19630 [Algoriphagus taiwanensis]|uniref:Uncharacterized protein n=1 Tax=Algoriphagus taiwanensis TaxID=1445656 RepID=A0ABQ6Q1E7_9BACT|nr:hypothetical protein Ataiwa_19630 [Algoriphagus taiwanensis]
MNVSKYRNNIFRNFIGCLFSKLTHNVCVYAVWGIGGLKNEAQRNVKPDLHVIVPRHRTLFEN